MDGWSWWSWIAGLPCGAILFCVPAIIAGIQKARKVKKAAPSERSVSDRGSTVEADRLRIKQAYEDYWMREFGVLPGSPDSMQARAGIIDHRIGLWHAKHAQDTIQSETVRDATIRRQYDDLRSAAGLDPRFGARIGEKPKDPGPKPRDIPHHPV